MKLTTFTVLLSLCSFVRGQGVNTCIPFKDDPACGCTLQDGKVINLKTLGKQDGQPAFSVTHGAYTYTYNPCYQYTVGGCANVAGCQQDNNEDRSLGTQSNVQYDNSKEDMVVKYTGGVANRVFDITLICKEDGDNEFTYNDEKPELHYKFTLSTRCACPDQCKGGGSSDSKGGGGGGSDPGVVGIILLSVFIFAVVVYFVAGMIIMRVKYNKTGSDVIPNKNFWFTLPYLVKDGVLFTFSPCINYYQNRRSGYASMK